MTKYKCSNESCGNTDHSDMSALVTGTWRHELNDEGAPQGDGEEVHVEQIEYQCNLCESQCDPHIPPLRVAVGAIDVTQHCILRELAPMIAKVFEVVVWDEDLGVYACEARASREMHFWSFRFVLTPAGLERMKREQEQECEDYLIDQLDTLRDALTRANSNNGGDITYISVYEADNYKIHAFEIELEVDDDEEEERARRDLTSITEMQDEMHDLDLKVGEDELY